MLCPPIGPNSACSARFQPGAPTLEIVCMLRQTQVWSWTKTILIMIAHGAVQSKTFAVVSMVLFLTAVVWWHHVRQIRSDWHVFPIFAVTFSDVVCNTLFLIKSPCVYQMKCNPWMLPAYSVVWHLIGLAVASIAQEQRRKQILQFRHHLSLTFINFHQLLSSWLASSFAQAATVAPREQCRLIG